MGFAKKVSVRSKMFLSYMLIFILPLLIIGISSLYWMVNNIKETTEEAYNNLMLNVENAIEDQFEQLDDLALQLSETSWIKTIMFMRGATIDNERIVPTDIIDYIQQLQLYKVGNSFTDDIAIYFHDKDMVISSLGKTNFRWFIEDNFNVEGLDFKQWESLVNRYNHAYIGPRATMHTYGRKRDGLIYIQSLPIAEKDNIKATCMYFIKIEDLYKMLDPLFIDEGTSVVILDENDDVVLMRDADDSILKSILDNSFTPEYRVNTRELKVGNETEYVFYNRSAYNGWTYIVSTPKSVIMKGVERVKFIFIVLIFLSCVVGISGSYVLASRNYRPLLNIMELIRRSADDMDSFDYNNEYLWLENSIHLILQEEEILNQRLEEQKPIVRNSYLKKLLDREFKVDDEFLKLLEFLDVSFSYGNAVCGVVTGAGAHKICRDKFISGEIDDCKANIYLIDDDGVCVILFNYQREQDLHYMLGVLEKELSCSVENTVIGIGLSYGEIQKISQSYKEARMAVRYRLIKENRNIILFDDIKQINHCYYYPIDEELQFSNSIRTGDYDGAMKLFREMLNINLEQKSISLNSIQFFFINVKLTVLKIVEQLDLNDAIKIDPNTILSYNRVDDMEIDIEEICSHVCDVVNKNKKSNNLDLRDEIRDYIDRHYTNEQLSLSSVADQFQISSSYLSRFFKEQFGCNFSDYITKMRIDAAKEKLSQSGKEIKMISREVGYNNDGTFRRLFKKQEGVSPSEYRSGLLQ